MVGRRNFGSCRDYRECGSGCQPRSVYGWRTQKLAFDGGGGAGGCGRGGDCGLAARDEVGRLIVMRNRKSRLLIGASLTLIALSVTLSIASRNRERSLLDVAETVLERADRLRSRPYWMDDDTILFARWAKAVPGKFSNGAQVFRVHGTTCKEEWVRSLGKGRDPRAFSSPYDGCSPDRTYRISYVADAAGQLCLRALTVGTGAPVGAGANVSEFYYISEWLSRAWSSDSKRWSILGEMNSKWILRTYALEGGSHSLKRTSRL